MKLYELPKGTIVRIEPGKYKLTFQKIDGMYGLFKYGEEDVILFTARQEVQEDENGYYIDTTLPTND